MTERQWLGEKAVGKMFNGWTGPEDMRQISVVTLM